MDEQKKPELYSKWLAFAASDFRIAKIAFQHTELLQSMFHLQQAMEKILKGLHVYYLRTQPQYTHDLLRLYDSVKDKLLSEDPLIVDKIEIKILTALNPFYIISRYPSYQENIAKTIDQQQNKKFVTIQV